MNFVRRGAALTAVVAAGTGLVSMATAAGGPHSPASITPAVQLAASANPIDPIADALLDPGAVAEAASAVGAAVASSAVWWDDVVGFGQYQISDGLDYLASGEPTIALALVSAGLANILVYGPQAGLMVAIGEAIGQVPIWQWLPYGYPFSESYFQDWGDLISFVQDRVSSGFEWISSGFEELSAGTVNWGLFDLFWGINELTVNLSLGLLVGPIAILDGDFVL